MEWVQLYDPLHQAWLSTVLAALPIVLLLDQSGTAGVESTLGRAHGLSPRPCSSRSSSTACRSRPRSAQRSTAPPTALFPIGWIVLNAVFLYNLTVAAGQFEIVKTSVARLSRRSAHPGAARRILVRCVHRGGGRFRHTGRDYRRSAQRSGFHSAVLRGSLADCQYGAGRVRRDRHADPDPGDDHRYPGRCAERDGRAAAADRLADRPGMAGRRR